MCCDPVVVVVLGADGLDRERKGAFFFSKKNLYGACCMTPVLLGKAGGRPGKRWALQVSFVQGPRVGTWGSKLGTVPCHCCFSLC